MIRKMRIDDLDAVAQVFSRVRQHSKFPVGGSWGPKDIESEFQASQGWIWAEAGVSGFLFARIAENGSEITQIAVDPERWGAGGGKLLLETALPRLTRPIWLEVHEENIPAQKLYEGLGFEKVGRRERYYRDGGAALLYSKT